MSVEDSWSEEPQVLGPGWCGGWTSCIAAVAETLSTLCIPSAIPVSQTDRGTIGQTVFAYVPLYQQMLPTCGFLLSEKSMTNAITFFKYGKIQFSRFVCFVLLLGGSF